jgi:hypothetical protein
MKTTPYALALWPVLSRHSPAALCRPQRRGRRARMTREARRRSRRHACGRKALFRRGGGCGRVRAGAGGGARAARRRSPHPGQREGERRGLREGDAEPGKGRAGHRLADPRRRRCRSRFHSLGASMVRGTARAIAGGRFVVHPVAWPGPGRREKGVSRHRCRDLRPGERFAHRVPVQATDRQSGWASVDSIRQLAHLVSTARRGRSSS